MAWPIRRGWTGGRDTGIRGAGDGGKGGWGRGKIGRGTGEEGAGVGKFWGRGLYQNLLFFTDFTLFFVYFSAITGYQKYLIDELK